jgi:hypothetical protein
MYSVQHRTKINSIVNFSSEERLKVITLKKPTVSVVFAQIARLAANAGRILPAKWRKMMVNKRGKAGR